MKKLLYISLLFLIVDASAQQRRAILEEFKGHKCGLCPSGDAVAKQLKNAYQDSLIVVAIHAGSLSSPNSSGTHTTDFRTSSGTDYYTHFGVNGVPKGMVNRASHNTATVIPQNSWNGAIQTILNTTPEVDIQVKNGYESSSRQLTLHVRSEALQALQGDFKLIAYITEDSIIDWQTNYNASPTQVSDYLHNHVLRDNINGTWGNDVFTSSAANGDTNLLQFAFTLPNNWNEAQLNVVAFIYNSSTDEILNAIEHEVDLTKPALNITDTNNPQSINENLKAAFSIYPNPTTGQLNISSNKFDLFSIMDINGRILINNVQVNQSIDVSHMEKGMYFVQRKSDGLVQKLIIR